MDLIEIHLIYIYLYDYEPDLFMDSKFFEKLILFEFIFFTIKFIFQVTLIF